jgi:hypothetical protein
MPQLSAEGSHWLAVLVLHTAVAHGTELHSSAYTLTAAAAATCPAGAGKPLLIGYGGPTPPSNIDDLLDNMESPLTKIDVRPCCKLYGGRHCTAASSVPASLA